MNFLGSKLMNDSWLCAMSEPCLLSLKVLFMSLLCSRKELLVSFFTNKSTFDLFYLFNTYAVPNYYLVSVFLLNSLGFIGNSASSSLFLSLRSY